MIDGTFLTPAQVSERIQIGERTVTRWLRTGYLPGRKFGRDWRIAPDELQGFLDSHANQPRENGVPAPDRACRARATSGGGLIADAEQSEIEIRPFDFQLIEDASYLKVHTYPRPTDRTVRLALIEWFANGLRDGGYRRIVNRRPMSHDEAMAYAKRFAEKFEVPVIYQREDGLANP